MEAATQPVLNLPISPKRLGPYTKEAQKHPGVSAADLYRWNTLFSGVAVAQISFVEMRVRNAMDKALLVWAHANGYADWLGDMPQRQWFDDAAAAPAGGSASYRGITGRRPNKEALELMPQGMPGMGERS